jgi:hypothetical protein
LLTLWLQTAGAANQVTVTALTEYNSNFVTSISVQNAAPANIVYATADTFATVSELNNMVSQLTTAFNTVVAAVNAASGGSGS